MIFNKFFKTAPTNITHSHWPRQEGSLFSTKLESFPGGCK